MKKLLLVALITMIGLTSFAAGEIQKTTVPVINKENTIYVKKEGFKVPEGATVTKKITKDLCEVWIIEWSDGEVWIIIFC